MPSNNGPRTDLNMNNFDTTLDAIIEETRPEVVYEDVQQQNHITNNSDPVDGGTGIEHKLDVMTLSNGWNDKNERIVISIGENAASYKWMHERSSEFYKNVNKVFSIVMIIFSTGLSAETIIPNDNQNLAINIVRRVFTYVITFLSILQNFLKFEQLAEQHMASALSFAQLYHEIQQQMCMYRRDRKHATVYVSETLKQYDSLIVNGPAIVNRIVVSFKETFKNSDISVPDIADRIQKIEIISEPKEQGPYNTKSTSNYNPNSNVSYQFNTKQLQKEKRYGRYGVCNLQQIHNAFQIQGDISDNDIQQANANELRELRKKFLKEKSTYEYERFLNYNPL